MSQARSSEARNKRKRDAGRDGGQFVAIPHIVLQSPSYRGLNHAARSLLLDIAMQHNRRNNGALVACEKYLAPLGWASSQTITRALRELLDAKLLILTRQGSRPNRAAWYALGWQALDMSAGLDIDPRDYRTGQYKLSTQPLKTQALPR
jgi:hypothetical protein